MAVAAIANDPVGASGGGASATGYYLVSRSTDAPANAVNLGALTSGMIKHTVSGGVSTVATATKSTDYAGVDVALPITITDDTATYDDAAINAATFTRTGASATTPAANYGHAMLFRGQDASKNAAEDMAEFRVYWSDATAATEDVTVALATKVAGAALQAQGSELYQFLTDGQLHVKRSSNSTGIPLFRMGAGVAIAGMGGDGGQIDMITNSVVRSTIQSSGFTAAIRFNTSESGSNTDAAFGWSNDSDNGLVRIGTNNWYLTCGASVGGTGKVMEMLYNSGIRFGFHGSTPVAQSAAIADATDAASVIARLNDLLAYLRSRGDIAT